MFKFLSILMLLASTIFVQNNHLYGDGCTVSKAYVDALFYEWQLDLSEGCPNLNSLVLYDREDGKINSPVVYRLNNDAGIGNNVNLKKIVVYGQHAQHPVALAYHPGIECYEINYGFLQDLEYLPRALPSLKALKIMWGLYGGYMSREKLAPLFENISKLEHLESLNIWTYGTWWGAYTFTDQEIEIFSKMHNLKHLNIVLGISPSMPKEFDQEKLQVLRELLPNTNIAVEFSY